MKQVNESLVRSLRSRLKITDETLRCDLDEVTLTLAASGLSESMSVLRDSPTLNFDLLIDVCGVDYADHPDKYQFKSRFAVIYHLLSLDLNHRLRVRVFCEDDEQPVVPSVVDIWAGANWFERETFDLYGIVFSSFEFVANHCEFSFQIFAQDQAVDHTLRLQLKREFKISLLIRG